MDGGGARLRRGAVLSHTSAAALWGLLRPIAGPVDVSVPSHGRAGVGDAGSASTAARSLATAARRGGSTS